MTRTVYFRQCRLVRPTQRGEARLMSWIPEKYAVLGKTLRLRDDAGWQDGWVVDFIGPYRVADDNLPDPHAEIKQHRKATGDSLRREKTA